MVLKDLLSEVDLYAYDAESVLDRPEGRGWWHRPFTREEIEVHPDRERIVATLELLSDRMLKELRVQLKSDILDLLKPKGDTP